MIDVGQAIDEEAVTVTLKAAAPGTYDAGGNYVPGALPDPLPEIQAAIQPVSGSSLRDLPEGIREDVSLVGWTRSSVAVQNEIIYGGSTYRIAFVWPRPVDGFNKFAMGVKG